MSRFINRDYNRTLHDDFVLNVQPRLGKFDGAVPQYRDDATFNPDGSPTSEDMLLGWVIKPIRE